jgi:hypothetical protein
MRTVLKNMDWVVWKLVMKKQTECTRTGVEKHGLSGVKTGDEETDWVHQNCVEKHGLSGVKTGDKETDWVHQNCVEKHGLSGVKTGDKETDWVHQNCVEKHVTMSLCKSQKYMDGLGIETDPQLWDCNEWATTRHDTVDKGDILFDP